MAVKFNISASSTKPLIDKFPYLFKYAVSTALNDTAFDAKKRLAEHAKRVFNNPRPMTINSGYVYNKSTPETLRAKIGLKDFLPKGTDPEIYLRPQIYGGGRAQKRFEKALIRKFPAFGRSAYFVPAMQNTEFLDRYGDLRGSLVTQMLSHLQAFPEQGYKGNIKNPKKALYFPVIRRGDYGMLHPGIYKRDALGSENFKAVVYAVKKEPQYRKRFFYFETVEKSARLTFPVSFSRRFQAMALKRIREYNLATKSSRSTIVRPLP